MIGKMNEMCIHCHALKFKNESVGMCCSNGKVKLFPLNTPPEPLRSYMSGTTAISKHFLENILKYNSSFRMTSFGASKTVSYNGYMPTFKVQGQIYHQIGSLLPSSSENSKFLQIYFVANQKSQIDQRCAISSGMNRDIVSNLQNMFHTHNHLIKLFMYALEKMPLDDYRIVIKADKTPSGEHPRRFNAPTTNEVAIVMVGTEFERRDIVIQKRNQSLQRIAETHRSYDALQYPIIFWGGEDGYHFKIMQINLSTGEESSKKVSAKDFYAYRIMIRENQSNHLIKCRALYNQFIVDMYAKIESERLLFIRLNQKKLRAEEYIHLKDAIINDENISDIGKHVILPSTYIGSPRHMHEYAQDALTYVRRFGRADLFITFTCNPKWKDINELLLIGQSPADRHDIIARVFKQKLTNLMNVITKNSIFGEVRCWMYSIEWQKRGLPHAHLLVWLKDKLRPTQIDDIISAELPDPRKDPTLYDIVCKNMIHGPCGTLNNNSPCMKDGKCTKRYPRNLIQETQTNDDGYPLYRRRNPVDGGHTTIIKMRNIDVEVDNRWIVPYSPILSKMFNAHINVEACNSVKAIKYICKYINKGSDMAIFEISAQNNPNDEITQYQMGRYISSNEAIWRILSFNIHERYPAVIHLSVHLENGQRVHFTESNARERALHPQNTTLTAFFQLCKNDHFARTLLYYEIPKYYTWNATKKEFFRRKQGSTVPDYAGIYANETLGRVYTVHPSNAECYYLRMLLHCVKGPQSFQALRTVNAVVYETYREACLKLGLLENDTHWEDTLTEAAIRCHPIQIRNLFAIIITTCGPSEPKNLWEQFKESMSEDLLYQARISNPNMNNDLKDYIFNEVLILIEERTISINNKTVLQLGLPAPTRNNTDITNKEMTREMQYDIVQLRNYVENTKKKLNDDQQNAYRTIMNRVENDIGGIIFLDAPGGTGKTFLLNLILAELRSTKNIAIAVASSGIAATLLSGGRTAHSTFKLPLNVYQNDNPTCNISKKSGMAQVMKIAKIIIWDELPMAHKFHIEALDRTLRDFKSNNYVMGNTLLVLAGDFRQTLPVIPRGTPADEINACLKSSYLWKYVKSIQLKTNMRVQLLKDSSATIFAKQLLDLGEGKHQNDKITNEIQFPQNFCQKCTSPKQLIEKVFPNITQNYKNHDWLNERAILAPRNDDVTKLNHQILNSIPGASTKYRSINTAIQEEDAVNYPNEFLNSLEPTGMPPHILTLKIGAPLMIIRNLDPPRLCNGSRVVIKNLSPNLIEATIINGIYKGENVLIPKIPIISTDSTVEFKRLQFPVKLSFAITINKSQGQTLRIAGLNLENQCFSHGQLYVGCSRVGSPKNLIIYTPTEKTKNIVYKKALE